MEPIKGVIDPGEDKNRRLDSGRRGIAMFGVLVLVVIFTMLGVGALTLATRETEATGSVTDIKSRQNAAFAGLSFALGEFQRDPFNFVRQMERWRSASVYAGGKPSQLYFQFGDTLFQPTLTKTKPKAFKVPGTPYTVVVELLGISVPSSPTEDPILMLRATGYGRTGDAQTIVATYQVRNVQLNTPKVTLGITHAFYDNGPGNFDNQIVSDSGDVFIGGKLHLNSSASKLDIKNGGLRVNGDFTWDQGVSVNVDGDTWITGNVVMKKTSGPGFQFNKNLVVGGNVRFDEAGIWATVHGSMVIQGTGGISDLHGSYLYLTGWYSNYSELYIPNGPINDGGGTNAGVIYVKGSVYAKQLQITASSHGTTFTVRDRMEWADSLNYIQTFSGIGKWGTLVARSCKNGSALSDSLTVTGSSWNETPANLKLDSAKVTFSSPNSPSGVNRMIDGLTPKRFDLGAPPHDPAALGMNLAPAATEPEVGFNPALDPNIASHALEVATQSGKCRDDNHICGASLQKQYADDKAAGSKHFYNDFFVLKISSSQTFDWDYGSDSTTRLRGKFLFLVNADISESKIWPTTAVNSDLTNPTNIEFIYVSSGKKMSDGFTARYLNNTTTPVVFTGYVRWENPPATTWDMQVPLLVRGAVHLVGDAVGEVGINGNGVPSFLLDQPVLTTIGLAFGQAFTDPKTGNSKSSGPSGFVATENWLQFRPVSELR